MSKDVQSKATARSKDESVWPLTSKARAVDILHTVIRDKELLLPTHEDRAAVERILHRQVGLLELVLDVAERRESRPMHHVLLLIRPPVPRQETVPTADDLRIEICRQLGPVIRQATNPEVSA